MSNFKHSADYQGAYNTSSDEQFELDAIVKLGTTDGRADAKKIVRTAAGRVNATAALRNLRERRPELFESTVLKAVNG